MLYIPTREGRYWAGRTEEGRVDGRNIGNPEDKAVTRQRSGGDQAIGLHGGLRRRSTAPDGHLQRPNATRLRRRKDVGTTGPTFFTSPASPQPAPMTPPSASGSLFAASRSSSTTMVLDRDEDEKAALAAAEAYGDERPAVGYFDGTAPLADTTSFASEVYRPTTQFAVPAGPARGRPNRRSHISSFSSLASNSVSVGTPRSTLPIIPSSRASPVLGPTRSGAFGVGALGLGLFNKLSLAAASEDSDIPPLSQPSVAPADLSLPSPLASILPPPPPAQSRGPIHPGAIWSGTQRSGRASYDVRVTFTHVDLESGKAGGYLEIHQLTKDLPELVTYFDAEIVGSKFGFLTNKEEWGATEADDWKHWSRFPLFRTLAKPTILKDKEAKKEAAAAGDRHEGAVPKDQMLFAHKNRPVVFMRWKERFVVPDHRKEDIQGASFAGELPPLASLLFRPS